MCSGTIELNSAEGENYAPSAMWGKHGADAEAQEFIIQCEWEGHVHIPVWATPAAFVVILLGCLYACGRKRQELVSRGGHSKLPMRTNDY